MYVPTTIDIFPSGFDVHNPPLGRRDSTRLVHTLYRDGTLHHVVFLSTLVLISVDFYRCRLFRNFVQLVSPVPSCLRYKMTDILSKAISVANVIILGKLFNVSAHYL